MVPASRSAGIVHLVIPGALTCRAMETLTEEERRSVSPEPERADGAARRRSQSIALLVAMRPPEWIKNILVFAGLVFAKKFNDPSQVVDAVLTFVAFCSISSAGYLFNDLHDVEHDRRHPEKRHRPIAAGEISHRHRLGRRGASHRDRDRRRAFDLASR